MRRLSGLLLAGALMMLPVFSQSHVRAAEQAAQKFTFDGDTALWTVAIKPDKTADFESVWDVIYTRLAAAEKPEPTAPAKLTVVQGGKAELAMIPVENSVAGRVADLHSLLPHTRLKIVAEHFQRVEHCLVALPGVPLKGIKTAKSHVQALAQCRSFLKKHGIQPMVHADTAGAAREIAEGGDRKSVV